MTTPIRLVAGLIMLEGALDDSETATALAGRLPLTFEMSRWGEEYYGDIGEALGVGESSDAREEMKVGELAYWPSGNALCVFFGPTPASEGDEPRAASPVNPICVMEGDIDLLAMLGSSIEVTVEKNG